MLVRHPRKADLLLHAERIVAGEPIQADVAAHVQRCTRCAEEFRAMKSTLSVTKQADILEPSDDLTRKILMKARAERNATPTRVRNIRVLPVVRFGAMAATLAIATALSFSFASGPAADAQNRTRVSAPAEYLGGVDNSSGLTRAHHEIQTIAGAVTPASSRANGLMEDAHRRALAAREADMSAAVSALKANPGNMRAQRVYQTSIEGQAESYKSLYIHRDL